MLAALAIAAALASAAPAPAEPSGPAAPEGLEALAPLVDSAREVARIALEEQGALRVENVRRRLGALEALEGAARPWLRGEGIDERLYAHWLLADAHASFARALYSSRAPAAARGEASQAWSEQVEATVGRALLASAAHLRSCRALAGRAGRTDAARRCAGLSRSLPAEPSGGGGRRARGQGLAADEAEALSTRLAELQPCADRRAALRPGAGPLELSARLSFDGLGRVESVALTPAPGDEGPVYDCLSGALFLWVLPALSDSEVELPLRIGPGR